MGLQRENFFVTDEGKQVSLEFFDSNGPASIVFVVDISSSMRGDKWENLMKAMKKFLATAHEGSDYSACHPLDTDTCLISSTTIRTARLIQVN